MTEQTVIDIGTKTVWVAIKVAAPALLSILIMGLVVSIFQAATQINEQTLSFIPKILAMTVILVIFGPFILQTMMGFTVEIMKGIPNVIHP
ncbi:MAG: flagellar biosynthetic protein FliQ [Zetaproteobacteria bacterium]|nr:flagellar biosynthetic protein FliQ [Pseudobdellovibrionaceae bacterium]